MARRTIRIIFIILLTALNAYSFDNEITHRDITTKATIISNLNTYLTNNFEFENGIETELNNISILKWLREGAYLEDSPMCRPSNHFHNPLKSWDQSYMSDEPGWLDLRCSSWRPWYSNVTWGTGYLSPAPNGSKADTGNQWDWDAAREYYYRALISATNTDRETNFARTFQALGQMMHLM